MASPNPSGRPANQLSIAALIKECAAEVPPGEKLSRAQKIALTMVNLAAQGHEGFARMVLERIDGKVTETLKIVQNSMIQFSDEQLAQIALGQKTPADFEINALPQPPIISIPPDPETEKTND